MRAYGAAAYLCKKQKSALVMAKSCVAPLKNLTLPRLELMSAVLGARLSKHIEQEVHTANTYFWSDSHVVLHWLQSQKTLGRFVHKQVAEIRDVTGDQKWRYCPTHDNPADLVTRGITVQNFQTNILWSEGPEWLLTPSMWPVWQAQESLTLTATTADDRPEQHVLTSQYSPRSIVTCVHYIIDIQRFSRYTKLLRVTAYVRRFIFNCRIRRCTDRHITHLTATEVHGAEKLWLSCCQATMFPYEINQLKSTKARLPLVKQLRLFLDSNGNIRCGGRIHNAPLSEDTKFPYLLPNKHTLTCLIVQDTHKRQLHSGASATITQLRQKYWIPCIRQCVKTVLRRCLICRRVTGRPFAAPEPPVLPSNRVADAPPFTVTGVDFTGALLVKTQTGNESKAYVCLFTCAATRAVHMEIVPDLSEESFMQAFRRFCSRKSVPNKMISDNADTYLAAAKQIGSLYNPEPYSNV